MGNTWRLSDHQRGDKHMKLSVMERFQLLTIIPLFGNLATIRMHRKLREALSFTELEMKKWTITLQPGGNGIYWKENGERDFTFGPKVQDIIVTALKDTEAKNALHQDQVSLWEKFIGPITTPDEDIVISDAETTSEPAAAASEEAVNGVPESATV